VGRSHAVDRCHDRARKGSSHVVTFIKLEEHVVTFIKLEEDDGERNKLASNVTSVEEKLGHSLNSEPKNN
jgi:hypothetical protein